MNANNEFRENLLKQDVLCEQNTNSYRQNIQQNLSKQLGAVSRAAYGIICLASIMALAYFVKWAFVTHIGNEMIRLPIQLLSLLAIILTCIMAVMTGWSTLTGRTMGYFYPTFVFGSSLLILIYYFVTMLYFTWIAALTLEDPLEPRVVMGNQIMEVLFFAMVLIGMLLIFRFVSKAHFESRRKLLEIEYKLCMVLEQLEKMQKKQ